MIESRTDTLLAHHRRHQTPWRVGEASVMVPTQAGLRGFPGVDPALLALAEVLRRGRFTPRGRALDLTQAPGALAAWSRLAGDGVDWTLAASSAAVVRALPPDAARSIALPWDVAGPFDTVVWRPPADRGVQRVAAELTAVARATAPEGQVLLLQHKDEGAQRTERLAAGVFGEVVTIGRDAGWRSTLLRAPVAPPPLDPWLAFDAPGGEAFALVGTFAAGKVDVGTAALLRARAEEAPPTGRVLDLGCGTGLLARAAAQAGASAVVAVDDDAAAVSSAARNLAPFERARVIHADLLQPVAGAWLEAPFDEVWCNPPFHVGRQVVGALSRAFVASAWTALAPGGVAWFVVNRALPYPALFAAWGLDAVEVTPVGVASHAVWRVRQSTNS